MFTRPSTCDWVRGRGNVTALFVISRPRANYPRGACELAAAAPAFAPDESPAAFASPTMGSSLVLQIVASAAPTPAPTPSEAPGEEPPKFKNGTLGRREHEPGVELGVGQDEPEPELPGPLPVAPTVTLDAEAAAPLPRATGRLYFAGISTKSTMPEVIS